jgi:hypothetical protein
MSPADILDVLNGTAPGDWVVNRPPVVIQSSAPGAPIARGASTAVISPRGRGGLEVHVGLDGHPMPAAAWSRATFGDVAPLACVVEVQSIYRGTLFRTHRAVSPDGWGGIPLPASGIAAVEQARFTLLRLVAQVLATPGFDNAWRRSGLALDDAPWQPVEVPRPAAPAWSPIG